MITLFICRPPHRHTRSSSLDLKHYKLTNSHTSEKQVNNNEPPSTQPPELPPPRLEKTIKMASVDTGYAAAPKEESFADFTHFPDQVWLDFCMQYLFISSH